MYTPVNPILTCFPDVMGIISSAKKMLMQTIKLLMNYDYHLLMLIKVYRNFRQVEICQFCLLQLLLPICPENHIKSNRKAMNRNWSNQKANPALKTKTGNK